MGFTRRDLLTFTGGSAAGLMLTPVPWSLLRDTAVLSENWPGIPQPPHGEIRTRSTAPLANGKPVAIERAVAAVSSAIAACAPRESVAILDPRPGRAASLVYRRFLAGLPNAVHCAPPDAQPFGPFGIDLENTRAILSFGAPVLDGWLSPGR